MTVIVKSEPYKSLKTIFTGEESNVKILDFDDYKIASLNNFRDFASNEEWVIWCNFLEKYEHTIDNIQQNAQIIDTIPNELFFSEKKDQWAQQSHGPFTIFLYLFYLYA